MRVRGFWSRCAAAVTLSIVAAACGDDGASPLGPGGVDASAGGGGGQTDSVDVCQLLTADEIMTAMGFPDEPLPSSENTGPSGPFTGCSWGTGWLLVQVAESDRLILPPSDPCPAIDLGDDARECPGDIKFLTNGVHVSITTLDRHPNSSLLAIADLLLPVVDAL